MSNIDYAKEIKKVYPDAQMESTRWGYIYIVSKSLALSEAYYLPHDAWRNAYTNLKEQGKII